MATLLIFLSAFLYAARFSLCCKLCGQYPDIGIAGQVATLLPSTLFTLSFNLLYNIFIFAIQLLSLVLPHPTPAVPRALHDALTCSMCSFLLVPDFHPRFLLVCMFPHYSRQQPTLTGQDLSEDASDNGH